MVLTDKTLLTSSHTDTALTTVIKLLDKKEDFSIFKVRNIGIFKLEPQNNNVTNTKRRKMFKRSSQSRRRGRLFRRPFFLFSRRRPYRQYHRRPTKRFRFPVFAPFGTEGFTLSPEEERKRENNDEDRNERERKKKGVEKDGFD